MCVHYVCIHFIIYRIRTAIQYNVKKQEILTPIFHRKMSGKTLKILGKPPKNHIFSENRKTFESPDISYITTT